ncbi:MAG: DNA (cytosine-5-)-methyltransferase [Ruminococcaceae bacterium]|nr:DNA (cytosine-5-)-methyltransferase [Oscillospiraceae bacterium]
MIKSKITVGSMFAGIGGICLGFKQAGFDIVWANEKDSSACRTYRNYFGNSYLVEGDICCIDKKTIPYFDVLTAGFPCQPFSVAGPHKGFQDKRGNLFFQIIDVAKCVMPKIIFLENVANLIDHDNGQTFIIMYNALSELGYVVKYKNMPSNEYGNTPQTRNRTYVVAFKNDYLCEKFAFPEPVELKISIFDIIKRNVRQKDVYYYNSEDKIWNYMTSKVKRIDSIYRVHDSGIHIAKNQSCPTLTASMGTRTDRVPIIIDEYGYRKLTVRECLEFQCFPNDFTFPKGTTLQEAYKQVGNSVCVTVIQRIAKQIRLIMEKEDVL